VPRTIVLNDQQVPLSTLPPSRAQKRFALAIVPVLFAALCATVRVATVPLRYHRQSIHAYATAMFVISSITSALLFAQVSLVHSRALVAIEAMANQNWPRILHITSAIEGPSSVIISVTDTGKGVDPKIVDRIFNPLFTTKSNGMGMGLAICRSIIEGHEGRLSASAGAEGGAVFQFALPGDAEGVRIRGSR
jgi:phosphoglycerate-specific signal transduction histidine kinase